MNLFQSMYCRTYQGILRFAMHFIKIRIPETHSSLMDVPEIIKANKLCHPIIVSGKHVSKKVRVLSLLSKLKEDNIPYSLYTDIGSDPTFSEIRSLYDFYKDEGCDSIIAIGGGSIIDASKALGCKIVKPNKNLSYFKGLLKVGQRLPFFIAIPTTAGTGSEATLASVITNESNGDKFAINDPNLVPNVCVLDSSLLDSLPQKVIAETGMDALCHAIEAYIGKSNTKLTREYALKSISLIHDNLFSFYICSGNDVIRQNMLDASYYAGISFTRAYVGYVHALAHAIGGMYHLPHGYCIAILLPHVLRAYKTSISKPFAEINDSLHLSNPNAIDEEKMIAMIHWINDLRDSLKIPSTFQGKIRKEDYTKLAKHANREANPLYPVPKLFSRKKLEEIIRTANGDTSEVDEK